MVKTKIPVQGFRRSAALTPAGGDATRIMLEPKRTGASHRRRGLRNLTASLTVALGMLAMTATARPQAKPQASSQPSPQAAKQARQTQPAKPAKKRRVISITINKGEIYTISGLAKGVKINSKVVANPNALTIESQPSGDIVLLGTEGGRSKIGATLANGEKVTYDVTINAAVPAINSLNPGNSPNAMGP